MGIHAIEAARDRRIAFSEREEGLAAQAAENVALGKAHPGFDLGLTRGFLGRAGSTPTP